MNISVLISSVALPSNKIGSWSNRISVLLKNTKYFDLVLSPTATPTDTFVFCQKRKRLPFLSRFRNLHIARWVGKDYLKQLRFLEKKYSSIDLVVLDDQALLEIIVYFKIHAKVKVTIAFSFHGHQLLLSPSLGEHVNKVFFLTHKGYLESLLLNEIFTPEVFIVGNGVDSSKFYPVSTTNKNRLKENLGFEKSDEIVIWMANERPKKGLHLFLKIADRILLNYPNIQFMVLGNRNPLPFSHKNIKDFGQIPNNDLPEYLQAGDYYFFTTLWKEGFGLSMVEAAKCGCTIIASDTGGVSEVNNELGQSYLVKYPNITEEWLKVFIKAKNERLDDYPDEYKMELDSYHSYANWEKKYLEALNS